MKIRFKDSELDFIRYVFKQIHEVQTYKVYNLNEIIENKINYLTEIVRIEHFNGFSYASGIEYYFRVKDSKSWRLSRKVTGLRQFDNCTFYGDDLRLGKNLIIFHLQKDEKILIIDYFKGFYPLLDSDRRKIITVLKR